jgi:hypothetical protein
MKYSTYRWLQEQSTTIKTRLKRLMSMLSKPFFNEKVVSQSNGLVMKGYSGGKYHFSPGLMRLGKIYI